MGTFLLDKVNLQNQGKLFAIFGMAANGTSFEEPLNVDIETKFIGAMPWKIFDSVQLEIKVHCGSRQGDLFCQVENLSKQENELHFNFEANGTVHQESMNNKGEISGATSVDVQIWKFEFEKENKKVLQLDIEIKELKDGMWHIFNPYFQATINYDILDGDTSGTVLLRFEKTTDRERRFTIGNTNSKSKQSFEIIKSIIVNPGNNQTIQIDYKENEKSIGQWKIRHERFNDKVLYLILYSE